MEAAGSGEFGDRDVTVYRQGDRDPELAAVLGMRWRPGKLVSERSLRLACGHWGGLALDRLGERRRRGRSPCSQRRPGEAACWKGAESEIDGPGR